MAIALGGAILGAIGLSSLAGGIIAGAIGGMIIGAAVGGLMAAVTGGDILKGVLFGAIGGAVTGGISGYFASAGTAVSGTISNMAPAMDAMNPSVTSVGNAASSMTANSISSVGSIGSSLKDVGMNILGKGLEKGLGAMMAPDVEDPSEARDFQARENALNRKNSLDRTKIQAKTASVMKPQDNTGHRLNFEARMAELNQRKGEFNQATKQWQTELDIGEKMKADRRNLFASGGRGNGGGTTADGSADGGTSIQESRKIVENGATDSNALLTHRTQSALQGPQDPKAREREVVA